MPKILNILLGLFTRNLRSNILIMALVAIWIGFGIATPTFWSADNIQNVLPQMAIIAIMACGMVFVIVTGGIDLSVGFGAQIVVCQDFLQFLDVVAHNSVGELPLNLENLVALGCRFPLTPRVW